MKRLGLDVDGVIASFSARFVQLANQRYGTDYTELDQHDWDFKPWFSKQQVDEVWEQDIKPCKNFWLTLKPLPGTDGLQHISYGDRPNHKAELFFITARVPTAGMSRREQTCTWLRNHFGITFPTVIVVDNPVQKLPIIKSLEIDNFIDDKGSTVRELANAGIRTYLKLSPYNCAEKLVEGIIPVESLNEYLEAELGRK